MAKKLQLGYREIEQRLADSFTHGVNPAEVGYKLLYSFGKSERDIERYKEGKGILKTFDGLLIKGLFCYRFAPTTQLTNFTMGFSGFSGSPPVRFLRVKQMKRTLFIQNVS